MIRLLTKKSLMLILIAVVLTVVAIFGFKLAGVTLTGNPMKKAVEIPIKPDYSLIPVYTLDGRSVYLNAAATPLEFFSVNCPHCQEDLPQIQQLVSDLKAQKPLIYVSTFLTTSDLPEAIKETKEFVAKYKLNGTVVIQAGVPNAYVKTVPSLVTLKLGSPATPEIKEGMLTKENLKSALAIAPASVSKQDKGTTTHDIKKQ